MLDNCQAIAPRDRLKIKYISPDVNQLDFVALLRIFPEILPDPNVPGAGQGILIVYGPMPTKEDEKTLRAFIGERKLYDTTPSKPGEKPKLTYKGEGEIFKELKFLTEGRKKRKIYFLQGNDEVDMNDDMISMPRTDFRRSFAKTGIGRLVDRLGADNYDVYGLSFNAEAPGAEKNQKMIYAKEANKKKTVPSDCDTLIIAGVTKTLPQDTLDAIDRYMDDPKAKLMVFVDVVADDTYGKLQNSGLETMLQRYGVDVTNEFLIRHPERQLREALQLPAVTPDRSENALARQFAGRTLTMRFSARVVKPGQGMGFKADTILQVETRPPRLIYAEKDVQLLNIEKLLSFLEEMAKDPQARAFRRAKEPVSVAVAVSDKDNKPRMVVFGDTEFITNLDLAQSPRDINYSMFASALDWMAEREDLGLKYDEHNLIVLDESVDYWRMVLVPMWVLTLASIGLGAGFWLVRRK
jgi:hypothetical protein